MNGAVDGVSWAPERFLEDVLAKPAVLRRLAAGLRTRSAWPDVGRPASVLLVGIGSSRYAAEVAARRMRAGGLAAVAESSAIADPPVAELTVVISAGGSSAETLAAASTLETTRLVALTNTPDSALAGLAEDVVAMGAGNEVSGVACTSFVATLVRLLELESLLTAAPTGALADRVDAAADAVDHLLVGRSTWLDEAARTLAGRDGTWLLSPLERWSSAMQGALVLREVPRRPAVGCETGEWSHVDVYLTATLDYRALVFAGSPWDGAATEWLTRRGATWWCVGGDLAGAAGVLRYPGDDDEIVALLAEMTVAELLAAHLGSPGGTPGA